MIINGQRQTFLHRLLVWFRNGRVVDEHVRSGGRPNRNGTRRFSSRLAIVVFVNVYHRFRLEFGRNGWHVSRVVFFFAFGCNVFAVFIRVTSSPEGQFGLFKNKDYCSVYCLYVTLPLMCWVPIGFGLAVVEEVEVSLLPSWLPFDVSRRCPSPWPRPFWPPFCMHEQKMLPILARNEARTTMANGDDNDNVVRKCLNLKFFSRFASAAFIPF